MTPHEFDALKAGDRIDGRNRGDGTVEQNGDVLIIRWDRDGAITYQLGILRDLWGPWSASPMAHWFVLTFDKETANQHEEILAGLAREVPHSRFRQANGVSCQWTYNGDGTMGAN